MDFIYVHETNKGVLGGREMKEARGKARRKYKDNRVYWVASNETGEMKTFDFQQQQKIDDVLNNALEIGYKIGDKVHLNSEFGGGVVPFEALNFAADNMNPTFLSLGELKQFNLISGVDDPYATEAILTYFDYLAQGKIPNQKEGYWIGFKRGLNSKQSRLAAAGLALLTAPVGGTGFWATMATGSAAAYGGSELGGVIYEGWTGRESPGALRGGLRLAGFSSQTSDDIADKILIADLILNMKSYPQSPRKAMSFNKNLPAGEGLTDWFGNYQISPHGSVDDVMKALHHERVHSFLSGWGGAGLRNKSYQYSDSLVYLEEAMAETYALLKTRHLRGESIFTSIKDGLKYPFKGDAYGLRGSRMLLEFTGYAGTVTGLSIFAHQLVHKE